MPATEENKFDIEAPPVQEVVDEKIRDAVLEEHIQKIAATIRFNEMKILDDFCQAYLADQSIQGKDLIGKIKNMHLTQQFFSEDPTKVKYYFREEPELDFENLIKISMEQEGMESTFKEWMLDFHKLRIQGFISDTECKNIMKRITARINMSGYNVKHVGFYQYEFEPKGIETSEPILNEPVGIEATPVIETQPVAAEVVA